MDGGEEDDGLNDLRNQIKELKEKYEAQQKMLRDLRESIDRQQQEVDELRRELARKKKLSEKLKEENRQLEETRRQLIKQELEAIESIDVIVLPKDVIVIKFNYKKR